MSLCPAAQNLPSGVACFLSVWVAQEGHRLHPSGADGGLIGRLLAYYFWRRRLPMKRSQLRYGLTPRSQSTLEQARDLTQEPGTSLPGGMFSLVQKSGEKFEIVF